MGITSEAAAAQPSAGGVQEALHVTVVVPLHTSSVQPLAVASEVL